MAIEKGTHSSWLMSCPASDGNFKVHLAQASLTELQEVFDALPEEGNKTKKKVILKQIQKTTKQEKEKNNGHR